MFSLCVGSVDVQPISSGQTAFEAIPFVADTEEIEAEEVL